MNKIFKKLAAAFIAGLLCSSPALACTQWDPTAGPYPDTAQICWGKGAVNFYGSQASSFMRLQVAGTDAFFFTTTGLGIGAAPTNALSVTGSANVTSNLTVTGYISAGTGVQLSSYTQAQVDLLVPAFAGQMIAVYNFNPPAVVGGLGGFPGGWAVCQSTGAALDQWRVVGSTFGVRMNGCGSGG